MAIYEFAQTGIRRLDEITFNVAGLHERRDLQRLLRDHIEVISPETLVISEEFQDWEESQRRIDLLAIDKDANLVVIELKRTEDGGHMDLQAIRYAAMVSTMTFEKAADVLSEYHRQQGKELDAKKAILDFLGWDERNDNEFAQDVRIVLAAGDFNRELTSSVLWLIDHGIDIRCVRLKPYDMNGRILVDVQQIIPPPEATEYQIQIREKREQERQARTSNIDFTRYDVRIEAEKYVSQWKRNAIFLVCKHLCDRGINPEEIKSLLDWRSNRVWFAIEGDVVDASEFEKGAVERAAKDGQTFNSRRWFCDDGELVRANGRTYAFSNQWGGASWHRAMNVLKEKYSQFHIEFSATTD
ncbi:MULTISPECIES: hypothetical protein [Bradyrhizobium]|uniref:DUF91 domain-containing protein n=1 Tax=Bradyrhizobium yuanmingense TaxID=108015 RepID=A0A1C3UDC2_9BRAD|nr:MULTISPECIES: hypothetical protein [Bradyrhizobium]MCA1379842.1 hypothetical protein [Bradyrhizobium sp. BRP05]MCA1420144.1 hypothetical protein [Bradyrhizobium sp. BRP23]TWI20824.1 hypothetical protein IQ15_06166 [Bradyrhizobium yuanmingense]SCB13434.1 hypothetical protein GA0061099_1001979 [Bradyrhizobium yuanmingense]